MAQLRGLGQPFGSPGGVINLPAPAGSALAGQIQMRAMEGIGQALGQYLGQKRQQEAWQQDQRNYQVAQQAAAGIPGLGGQIPSWGMPQMQSRMGQQAQRQSQLGQMFGTPYGKPPWWVQGATQGQIEDYRGRIGGPLVQIGEKLLSPEKRQELAEADYEKGLTTKALSPTEQKGVQATISNIMGEGQTMPAGLGRGPIFNQEAMNKKWEETMEATGHAGRSKVQQRQIESEFDRYVAMLNKGKGLGVIKNQYQWSRSKYNQVAQKPAAKSLKKEQFITTYRGLKSPAEKQKYINKYWRPEFGRSLE